jgi:hypothetical protein
MYMTCGVTPTFPPTTNNPTTEKRVVGERNEKKLKLSKHNEEEEKIKTTPQTQERGDKEEN